MHRSCLGPAVAAALLANGSALAQPSAQGFAAACREVVATRVTLTRPVPAGSESQVRTELLRDAAADAIRQVVGSRVAQRSSLSAAEQNGEVDARYRSRMVAQSAGYARGRVTSERVLGTGDARSLELVFDAEVCIPRDPQVLPQTVALPVILSSRGEENERLSAAVAQSFTASRGFTLLGAAEPSEFADIHLSGRILRLDVTPIPVTSDPLARVAGAGRPPQQITLSAVLSATRQEDGAVFRQLIEETRNIGGNADPRNATEQFVLQQLSAASIALRDQMQRSQGGTARAAPPASGRSGGISW